MTRKDFFKKLGIGIGVAMIAPKILAETEFIDNSVIWDEDAIMPKNFDSISIDNHYSFISTKDTQISYCGGYVEIETDSRYLSWNDVVLIPAEFTNLSCSQLFMCVSPNGGNKRSFLPFDVRAKVNRIIPKGTRFIVTSTYKPYAR